MNLQNIQCKHPKTTLQNKDTIDVEINHPIYGWIPFTASPNDIEAHGREIYAKALAGVYGEIEMVDPPEKPEVDQDEVLIQEEINKVVREMAIERLQAKGKLTLNFVDSKSDDNAKSKIDN